MPVEVFTWWLPADPEQNRRKRTRSSWKMTREQAAKYPGAECIEDTREVRQDVRGDFRGVGAGAAEPPAPVQPQTVMAESDASTIGCQRCESGFPPGWKYEPGWVCEDHEDRPWGHDGCGAPGMRCVCNPSGLVRWGEVFAAADPQRDKPIE